MFLNYYLGKGVALKPLKPSILFGVYTTIISMEQAVHGILQPYGSIPTVERALQRDFSLPGS